MNTRRVGRPVCFLILSSMTVLAQVRDVAPLRSWPAPLYWHPNEAEREAFKSGIPANALAGDVASSTMLVFVAMTPCRVIDTRNGSGLTGYFGPPSLAGGAVRVFPVQSSTTCSIPSNAQAYSFNITVVPQGFLDFLTMWPDGQPRPTASTLNGYVGTVIANAAVVPAGTSGAVDVYASQNTDVIVDINGYYVPQGVLGQGSAAAPSLSFAGDPGTGIYSAGAGTVNIATAGTNRLQLTNGLATLAGNLSVSGNGLVGGTLGIGATPSASRVEIGGQDALRLTGFNPFLTWRDTSTPNNRLSILQGFDGGFTFYPHSHLGGEPAMYLQNLTGNLGIGTSSPGFLLDVANRVRVRQAGVNSAGMFFFQGGSDRGFVGMPDDNHVGFWGSGSGWGLTMDTNTGSVSLGNGLLPRVAVHIDPFAHPGTNNIITKCYNSRLAGSAATTAPCGFDAQYQGPGKYLIDFKFDVSNLFPSLMPYRTVGTPACEPQYQCPMIANLGYSPPGDTHLFINMQWSNNGLYFDDKVTLILF
jgi:hypothetical protein